MQPNILDANNSRSRLPKSARAGEDVVIASRGKLVALAGDAWLSANPGSTRVVLGSPKTHRRSAHVRRTAEGLQGDGRDARESGD